MTGHGPDDAARGYVRLALRLDRHLPGTVDGYYGPAEIRAAVDAEGLVPAAALVAEAVSLRQRIAAEIPEPDRRHWLDVQLAALETLARTAAGETLPYLETLRRCFAYSPTRRPEARFDAAARVLDDLLPGDDALVDRLDAEDAGWIVPPDRVRAVVDLLVAGFRDRAGAMVGLPAHDELEVRLVRDQPWSGYNWYHGGYRSTVDINLDLPIRLPALVETVAHETYPGHHLEHALKEEVLVQGLGRIEASALLINTPECLISEGLADLGATLVAPLDERAALLESLAPTAGVPVASDPARLREAAARQPAIGTQRGILAEARINAALLRHGDGRPPAEARAYLVDVGRMPAGRAAKSVEFMEHPLWRLYVFVYDEGEALLRRWLEAVPEAERPARFGRLLREELTPPAIEAELAATV